MQNNILLIVLDAVRPDHLSTYGYERMTDPFLSDFAENAVVFENAFANSNWTPTSHGTIFTGELPSHSDVYGGNLTLPSDITTLPEHLSRNGYQTFATAAGAHIRSGRGFDRGFDEFHETYRIRPSYGFATTIFSDISAVKQSFYSIMRGHDNYTYYKIDRLKKWISTVQEPFFAFVNFKTAHHRYNPPRPYKSMFSEVKRPKFEFQEMIYRKVNKKTQSIPNKDMERLQRLSTAYPIVGGEFEPQDEEIKEIKSWYDGAIRYLDSRIESLISFIMESKLMENTQIIITSDHGEMFGEHGLEKHQYSLFEELLRVPLIIHSPSKSPARVADMVSLLDLYQTILETANIDIENSMYRTNILKYPQEHEYLFAEVGKKSPEPVRRHCPQFTDTKYNGPLQSIRSEGYKFIRWNNGRIRLYDWKNDPNEKDDISDTKPDIAGELEQQLQQNLGTLETTEYQETIENSDLRQQLEDLGYI